MFDSHNYSSTIEPTPDLGTPWGIHSTHYTVNSASSHVWSSGRRRGVSGGHFIGPPNAILRPFSSCSQSGLASRARRTLQDLRCQCPRCRVSVPCPRYRFYAARGAQLRRSSPIVVHMPLPTCTCEIVHGLLHPLYHPALDIRMLEFLAPNPRYPGGPM